MAETDAGTDTSLDAGAIAQIGAAAERLRKSALWTAGAVAAVGTTVGGAITFVGLKDLDGKHFELGAIGLGVVVLAALGVIALVAGVLAPTDTQLAKIGKVKGVDSTMLFGEASVKAFASKAEAAERELLTALHAPAPPETGVTALAGPAPVPDADVGRRERAAAMYGARAERIRLIVHFYELRARWMWRLGPIMALAIVGAGGIVMYQSATSHQRQDKEEAEAETKDLPVLRDAPQLIVRFKPGALGPGIGEGCAGTRKGVRVGGQRPGQAAFLLHPDGGTCKGRFVRVDRKLVTFERAPVRKR